MKTVLANYIDPADVEEDLVEFFRFYPSQKSAYVVVACTKSINGLNVLHMSRALLPLEAATLQMSALTLHPGSRMRLPYRIKIIPKRRPS